MDFIKFEPGQKFARPDAPVSPNAQTFDDAGIKLTANDLVVDIDAFQGRHKELVAMLDELGVKTQTVYTKRGAHLYFKKSPAFKQSHGDVALGIQVEYKHDKNAPNGLTFRRDGVNREMVNEGVRQALPWFFKPWRKVPNFLGREQGDNRQTDLWQYTSFLAKAHDRDEYLPVLRAINDYIFAEPLEPADFEHATREDGRDQMQADESDDMVIARQIVEDLNVVRYRGVLMYKPADPAQSRMVGATGEWYMADVDKYNGINQIIVQVYCAAMKPVERWNVYTAVQEIAPTITNEPNVIRLKNGFLMGSQFVPMTDNEFTPHYINRGFHKDPTVVPSVETFLETVSNHNDKMREFLLEMAGYSLLVNPESKRKLAKVFFIYGPGGNGKSTFLDLLRRALGGRDNTSALSLDDLGDPTKLVNLENKLANLGDDQPDEPIRQQKAAYLKNLSAGSTIAVRKLYQTAHDATITANLIFTTNHVLNIYDSGKAMKRRVQWVPMMNTSLDELPDEFWKEFNSDKAAAYFFDLIVPAFQRLMARGSFVSVPEMDRVAAKLQHDNNSAVGYLQSMDPDELTDKPAGEVYHLYKDYAIDGEESVIPKRVFDQIVEDQFELVPTLITEPETGKRAKWYRDNDHTDAYITDFMKGVTLEGLSGKEVLEAYRTYCKSVGVAPEMTLKELVDVVVQQTDYSWKRVQVDGKRVMRFVK